jgi:AdoMet-dependent rRNA methyltransferase SPB1
MGRYDFKYLLKWRLKMVDFRDAVSDDEMDGGEEVERNLLEELKEEKDISELTEEELKKEIQEMKEKQNKLKKNLLKRAKIREKKRQPKQLDLVERKEDLIDEYMNDTLFSLKDIKDVKSLESISTKNINFEKDDSDIELSDNEEDKEENSDDEFDSDEEDNEIENQLEEQYTEYLNTKSEYKRNKLLKKRVEKKKTDEDLTEKLIQGEEVIEEDNTNPLIAKFNEPKKVNQWFSQNIFDVLREDENEFQGYNDDGEEVEEEEDEDEDEKPRKKKKFTKEDSDSEEGDYEELKSNLK